MIKIVAAASSAWLLVGAVFLLPGMAPVAPATPMASAGAMTTVPVAPTSAMATDGVMTTVPMAPTSAKTPTAPAGAMTVNSLAKSDRLDLRKFGPGCSERGWPYYESSCIRYATAANGEAKPVRIIAIDRLPPGIELAASR